MFYVFSNQFSLQAAFEQTERQKKMDWSFLLMSSLNYNSLHADHSIVPAMYDTPYYFGSETGYTGGRYFSAGVLPGIGLTIPVFNFFAAGAVFAGYGLMFDQSHFDESRNNSLKGYVLVNLKFAAGYNGDNIFHGLSVNSHAVDKSDIGGNSSFTEIVFYEIDVKLFFGIRM